MNDKMNTYVSVIHEVILSRIDYPRLQIDYATQEKVYTKGILNALHTQALHVYDTAPLESGDADYVLLPGLLQSKKTGRICLALLEIDLISSGELCDLDYITQFGCITQSNKDIPSDIAQFLSDTYGDNSYDYAYTVQIKDDIHIDESGFSPDFRDILDTFRNYHYDYATGEVTVDDAKKPAQSDADSSGKTNHFVKR